MTISERLDEIQARADKATDGPWEVDPLWCQAIERNGGSEVVVCFEDANTEFIAAARSDVPALVAALRAVLDLHRRNDFGECDECSVEPVDRYPCPTVKAVTAVLDNN
ncbi:hypothetical protein G6009_00995 [Dietzia sp. SLG510A3-30A2]|nr:hypothetical protein [Dietzia sp. SLG510A3-30A2]